VFILLPLTSEEQVDSTQLVSIGAGLTLLVVAWEVFGSLERGVPLFESWGDPEVDEQQDEEVPIRHAEGDRHNYETFNTES
jgi:hypothetical protein